MKFKDNVIVYLYNRNTQLDNEYISLVNNYRFHHMDEADLLEIIIAKARRDLCDEIIRDVYNMLTLKEKSPQQGK